MDSMVANRSGPQKNKILQVYTSVIQNAQTAVLLYTLFFLIFSAPFWLGGEVLAPHSLGSEIGLPDVQGQFENRQFTDYTRGYIPYLQKLYHAPRHSWIATWDDANELGRHMLQSNGFSPLYPLTWLASLLTNNPYFLFTLVALAHCYLAGLFVIGLSIEEGLLPLAAGLAGCCIALCPPFVWWLIPFPMFITSTAWTLGVAFSLARLSRTRSFPDMVLLLFCVYSLAVVGHPQLIVISGYGLAAYSCLLIWRHFKQAGTREALSYVSTVLIAIGLAIALSLPFYLDVYALKQASSRIVPPNLDYFTAIQHFENGYGAVHLLVTSTFQNIYGNPISSSYPLSFGGHYTLFFGPVVLFCSLYALWAKPRSSLGWWLLVVFYYVIATVPEIYNFFVHYFGMNMSRILPTNGLVLPIAILTAQGLDALISPDSSRSAAMWIGLICLGLLLTALAYAEAHGIPVVWGQVALTVTACALLVMQPRFQSGPLPSMLAIILVAMFICYPMLMRQRPENLMPRSPLVEFMREKLPPGSRYAIVSPNLNVLWPETNAQFDLRSIHSYNSLTSRRYHKLIEALGGKMENLRRLNKFIRPNYHSTAFWMSDIGLILSDSPLDDPALNPVGVVADVHIYAPQSRMGPAVQVWGDLADAGGKLSVEDPRAILHSASALLDDQGDRKIFKTQPGPASVLILNHLFDEAWKAEGLVADAWHPLETVEVNGAFQGVRLPSSTTQVRTTFHSYLRFAWLAHLFFAIVLVTIAARWYLLKQEKKRPDLPRKLLDDFPASDRPSLSPTRNK